MASDNATVIVTSTREAGITALDPSRFTPLKVPDTDTLDNLLQVINENGDEPTLVGFDRNGVRFLAYLYTTDGEVCQTGVVTDGPRSTEFDYDDVGKCEDCGAFWTRSPTVLTYPVAVL